MRLGDVIERHHDDGQKEHRRDRPDPVPVGGQDAVLITRRGPAHELQGSEVGRDEAQAGDPGGHLPAGHEKVIARLGEALQIEADRQNDDEIEGDDGHIDAVERHQRAGILHRVLLVMENREHPERDAGRETYRPESYSGRRRLSIRRRRFDEGIPGRSLRRSLPSKSWGAKNLPGPMVPPAEGAFVFHDGSRFRPSESAFLFSRGGLWLRSPGPDSGRNANAPFSPPAFRDGEEDARAEGLSSGKPEQPAESGRNARRSPGRRIRPVRTARPARQVKMMCPPAEIS
ncbi:MAG: hypothetical protein BWX98_02097 [Candidatus Aminicenantes bacterium ADurb.Bin147]|nr:MAG: hypothetical protein BWX98_02097 [Candidatus Aminicenantes bacterium ADurb.Bin147]